MKGKNILILFTIVISSSFALMYIALTSQEVQAGTWSQTKQEEFALNTQSGIDIYVASGDAKISDGAYSTDNNTVLLMHFGEGSGSTPIDSSGKGNNGTISGATWTIDGKFGNALSFDGNDQVDCGSNASLDFGASIDFTEEAWIKTSSFSGMPHIIQKPGYPSAGYFSLAIYHVAPNPGKLYVAIDDVTTNKQIQDTIVVTDNVWHHVAATFDRDGYMRAFVDGIERGTAQDISSIGDINNTTSLFIGSGGSANYFNGTIDEVRISNIVRYTSNFTSPSSLLTSGTITSPRINSGEPITNIRLDWEDTRPAGTSITYSATNNGGVNWYELPGDNVLFTFPSAGTDLRVKAELRSGSGTPTLHSWSAEYSGDPYGAVYDAITGQAIAGAEVILHTPDGSIYSGTPQDNPQITDVLGRYNFYADKGKYYITSKFQGYKDYTSSIFTQDGGNVLVNINLEPLDFVAQNGLIISQTANKTTAKRGDIITYFFKIKNTNSQPVYTPEISVKLPYNFKYIKDSSLRDGVKSTDPKDTSGRLIFSPDNIGVNTSITYSYRVRVGIDAYEGKNISEGKVNYTNLGQEISTGPVYSVVYIKSLFSPKGLVIGKVFEDANSNGIQDIGESPIPYAAIVSEDGKVVLTDENGQYSIIGFNYDTHVLKLDQHVLPGGPFAVTGLNPPKNFPKDIPPMSKTIDIPESGLIKCNFAITPEERSKYRETNKEAIASWEERLSGTSREDTALTQANSYTAQAQASYNKGVSLYAKGKYEEAISEFQKVDKAYQDRKSSLEPVLLQKSQESSHNEWLLVGLADGEIGKLQRYGNVAATDASDKGRLNKELYKNGRVAFYLKGLIQGKYLLTARLDTSKEIEDELYESIDADRYYPIYGDSSTQFNETDSSEPLYVALSWNKNLIKYGNFSTDEFSEVEYAKYSRVLPGLKIHLEGDRAEVTTFASQSRQIPRKDIINPRGLSGPYYMTRSPVIEQSERVYLEVRDKDKADVVLSTISYERDKDYDVFYDEGYIYFSEPIRQEDRYGNPQYIITTYEYSPPLDPQYITEGVRIKIEPIKQTLTLGFTDINQNADNLHLTGADAELSLFNNTTTLTEEYSYSDNNFTNYATKAQIATTLIPKANIQAHYLNVNDGFSNPTGTLDQGVEEYRERISYNIIKPTDIILDHYQRRSILSHMRTTHYGTELLNKWDRLVLSSKAIYERQKDEDTMNALSDLKFTTLSQDISYKLTKRITLHSGYESKDTVEEKPLGNAVTHYDTLSGRVDYQLDKDNLLYLRNEHIEAAGYMENISAVGVEQILDEKTTSYAEYEKEGDTLRQNMGYKSKVKLTKWLNSNVSFERSRVSGATSLDSDASSISIEAKPKDELWLTSKVEVRHYQKTKEYNLNYESKDELTPEVTAFSKGSFSRSKDQDTTTVTRRDKQGLVGFSYRPIANDRLNVIGKYEYKRKENIQIASQESQTTNHIGSVEAAYDLTKNLTLGSRYAMNKSVEKGQDSIDRSHVNLFVTRLNYRLTPTIDALAEQKYIYLHETGDWKLSSSIEVGYKPIKDLRLGVGYTFAEYNEGDLAHKDQDYLSRGPYVKLSISPSF